MEREQFYDALDLLDDGLIAEAAGLLRKRPKKIITWSRVVAAAAICLVVSGVLFWGGLFNQKAASEVEPEIESNALFVDYYTSVDDMIKAADIIVTGEVVDSIPERRHDMIFTKQKVRVDKVYHGHIKSGDVILVLQTGGSLNGMVTKSFDEIPLFKKGEYVLFLYHTDEGHYNIQGGYQGAGTVTGNKVQFSRVKGDAITKALSGKSLADLETIIRDKVEQIHGQ